MRVMQRIQASADALQARFGPAPKVAVVLGSGLGAFADRLTDPKIAPYPELGLPMSGVPGHAGKLHVGRVGPQRVAVLAGRLHAYEGHDLATVVLPVRALARWGVKGVILTSAVGSIDPTLRTGQVVVIEDHLNFLGGNPLRGANLDELGPRFPDLTHLYTPRCRELAHTAAGRKLPEGVYAAMPGPSYETPAEIRMLERLGARVVGMSTVPEAIAAGHAGMEVLALSVVANAAAGLSESALTHQEVTEAMSAAAPRFVNLLRHIVETW